MRASSRLFRVSLWLASTSLSLASTVPAFAQAPAPPDAPAAAGSAADAGDPPAIAGRVSDVSGTVSFHAAGDTNWAAATMNYPVTNGDGFWTEPTAHTALQIGDDSVVLAGSTEFEISALDVSKIAATEAQGASFLNLPSLPNGQTVAIDTPRGQVQISTPGRYELVAGDTNDATTVTVVEGAAHIEGTGVSLDVGPNQTATIGGTDTFTGSVGAMQEDQFLRTQLEQAQQVQQRVAQLPQDVRYMTGGTALAESGSFESTQQYGQVWYPRDVPADWAPYRDGHWAYVAPWGWNWVDNARWGFAPFHYGRWVQYGGRWGWCAGAPGVVYGGGYPVYSPALVSFVGVGGALLAGAALGFGVGFGHGGGGIGWVPLGFNEPYYPAYHVSQRYFENINRYSVTNIHNYNVTNIRNVNVEHFANARYATVMPESAMVRGEGGSRFARPLPVSALSQVHPVFGRPPVAPTRETPNLSRAAAREYHVPEQREAVRGAPGPAIRAEAERGRGPLLRAAAPPPNVRAVPAASVRGHGPEAERPQAVRPGEAGRPGEAPAHPGLPGLRGPGAGRPATAPVEARHETPLRGETGRPGEVSRPTEAARPQAEPHTAAGLPALRGPGAAPPGADRHTVSTAHAPEPHAAARTTEHAMPAVHTPERPVEHYATPRSEPARAEPRRAEPTRAEPARAEPRRAEPARAEPRAEPPHREAAPRAAEAPRPHAEAHAAPHAAAHPEDKR